RPIGAGEPVVVDIGGTMPSGYCSDCTRTYVAGGAPPADFVGYYAVLQEAQRAAVAAVAPGVSAESVDGAARTPIAGAGYGPAFSCTAPASASGWRPTRTRTSSTATPSRWPRAWRSPS